MNKLLSTPLTLAISTAFMLTASLSACTTTHESEKPTASNSTLNEQNATPEEAARIAAEKRKAEEKKRQREMRRALPSSGGCGH